MSKTSKRLSILPAIMLAFYALHAQTPAHVKQLAYADSLRLVTIFKDLHQNPELGFMEVRTAGIVANELKALGYTVITGIAKTGVAGVLKNGDGPVVMYRADMDALPVKELTGLPYACTKTVRKEDGTEVPVMHACGHDAHVTWMLGAAKIMAALKNEWRGTLVFIAQPAEEAGNGAQAMLDDKMYERGVPVPDYLFGMHTWPIPVGTVQNGFGDRFAGTDQLDVTFYGIGGHGSSPELTKDPVVMASNAIMQYQTIISRSIAAQDAAVITAGSFQAGTANNIIPSSALLKMNLRWFTEKTRDVLLDGIRRINEGIAIANDLPKELYPTMVMKDHSVPLVNNEALVNRINAALARVMDAKNIVSNTPSVMVSENFHYLVKSNSKTVYDYMMVGTANPGLSAKAEEEGKKYPFFNHNGNYQVDLSAIPLGTAVGTTALLELFKKREK